MSRNQYLGTLAVLATFGFLGAFSAAWLRGPSEAHAATAKTVTAEEFQLVDSDGTLCGRWNITNGSPGISHFLKGGKGGTTMNEIGLSIIDRQGHIRAMLGKFKSGTFLQFFHYVKAGKAQKKSVVIGSAMNGNGSLVLFDMNEQARTFTTYSHTEGVAIISILTPAGTSVWSAP